MSRVGDSAVALAAAAIVLAAMAWFDRVVVGAANRNAVASFDMGQAGLMLALAQTLVAGSVLLLAVLAWRSRSVAVGVLYAAAGGYLALEVWVTSTFATQINDTPAPLPEPFLGWVSELAFATRGPLHAVGIIGGGMVIAGTAVIVQRMRDRAGPGHTP